MGALEILFIIIIIYKKNYGYKSTFSIAHVDRIVSCAHVKRWKRQNYFKFGTSIGHFSSGRAASRAVKGLWARFGCSKICMLLFSTVCKETDTVMCMHIHVHTCMRTRACTLTGTRTQTPPQPPHF